MIQARLNKFKQSRQIGIPANVGYISILAAIAIFVTVLNGNSANGSPLKEANSGSTSETSAAQDASLTKKRHKGIEDLPNFHKVHPYLYRGGEPTEIGLDKLKEMGVKTIIDLRSPGERAFNEPEVAKEKGFHYIHMLMSSKAPTNKQVTTLLKELDKAKDRSEPLFVHCAHGSDRTGCMVGIIRVARDDWSYDDTYKEMRKYWFGQKYTELRDAVKQRSTH